MKKIISTILIAISPIFVGGSLIAYGQTTVSNLAALDAYMRVEFSQYYANGATSKTIFENLKNENPQEAAGLLEQYKLASTYVAPAKQAEAKVAAAVIKVVAEHPEVSVHDSSWDTTQVGVDVVNSITDGVAREFKATAQEIARQDPALSGKITQITQTQVMPALQDRLDTAININEVLNKIDDVGGAVEVGGVFVSNAEDFNRIFLTSVQAQQKPQEIIDAFSEAVKISVQENNVIVAREEQRTLDTFSENAVNQAAIAFKRELVQGAAAPVSTVGQGAAPALDSIKQVAKVATDNVAETATRAFFSGDFEQAAKSVSNIQNMQENFFNPEKAAEMNQGLKALQGADTATMQREMANFAQKYGGVEIKAGQFNEKNLQAFQQGIQQAVQSNYSDSDIKRMAQEQQTAFTERQQGAFQGGPTQQQTFGFDRTVGEQGRGFGTGQQGGFTPPFGQSGGQPSVFPQTQTSPTGFFGSNQQNQQPATFPISGETAKFGVTQPTISSFTPEQKAAFEQYQNNTPPSMTAPGMQASGSYKPGAMPPPPSTGFTPGTSGTAPTTQGMPAGTMPTNVTGSYKPGTAMSPSQPSMPPPPGFTPGISAPTPTTGYTGTGGMPSFGGIPPPTGISYPSFQPSAGGTSGYTAPSFTPTGTYTAPSTGSFTPSGTYTAPTGGTAPSGGSTPPPSGGSYSPPPSGSYSPPPSGGSYSPPPPTGSVYDSYLGSVRNTLGSSTRRSQQRKPILRKIQRNQSPAKNNSANIIDSFDYYSY